MKAFFLIPVLMFCTVLSKSQETAESAQVYLENEAGGSETEEVETEDRQIKTDWYIRHKVNINRTSAAFLTKEFGVPADAGLQLETYIRLAGPLINVLELQAVPGWDPDLVNSLLPFITVDDGPPLDELFREYFRKGKHMVQLRVGLTGERSRAYTVNEPKVNGYEGNRLKSLLRYNFAAGQHLRWGLTFEKDAGESLFKKGRSVDFSAFYFQMGFSGIIKTVVLGDFLVNLGQGLIHWQSAAMRKSAESIVTIRQGNEIRTHGGTSEHAFHRGAALHSQIKNWNFILFGAYDFWDANVVTDSTDDGQKYFSSIQTSGLHRTISEIEDKNVMKTVAAGAAVNYKRTHLDLGLNSVFYHFNGYLKKENRPANLYAIRGKEWFNYSLDYKYSFRSWYFFGEVAVDRDLSPAILTGAIAPLHPKVDISVMYRRISPAYQALQANAFTEQSMPSNESGIYTGMRVIVSRSFKFSGYVDLFRFPWLRSTVSSPSSGNSILLQILWNPDKKNEVLLRYVDETKMEDEPSDRIVRTVEPVNRRALRLHQRWMPEKQWEMNVRVDVVSIRKNQSESENGYLFYADALFKPEKSPFSAALRVARFSTQGWASRVYSQERDVRNYHTINPLSGDGWRSYFLVNYKFCKYVILSAKAMLTYNIDKQSIGSGVDLINRPYRSDYRLQFLVLF